MCQRAYLDHFAHRPRAGRQASGRRCHHRHSNGKRDLEILKLTTIHDEAAKGENQNGDAAGAQQQ